MFGLPQELLLVCNPFENVLGDALNYYVIWLKKLPNTVFLLEATGSHDFINNRNRTWARHDYKEISSIAAPASKIHGKYCVSVLVC